MKLEVGMYARTKGGFIDKIISFKSTISNDYVELEDEYYANKKDILKASHNIIDLIEEGDYVNGCKVIDFMYSKEKKRSVIVDSEIWGFDAEEIKSIVTKEMFSNISYEVSK